MWWVINHEIDFENKKKKLMNGLKNGENQMKSVKGAEGIGALSSSGDFTPLASVLSTTVAQSHTVSPQKPRL